MPTDALARFQSALREHGSRNVSGDDWTCPAHDDSHASLTVGWGSKGEKVIFQCAVCGDPGKKRILEVLGLTFGDLFQEERRVGREFYPYEDEQRVNLYAYKKYIFNTGRKQSVQWRWELDRERWKKKVTEQEKKRGIKLMDGVRRVPYRLPELLETTRKKGAVVHLTEGEKDVEAIRGVAGKKETATCHPEGALKWKDEFCQYLQGAAEIVVWADRDLPGYKCALGRLRSVRAAGLNARAVLPIPTKPKADAYDHLAEGFRLSEAKPVSEEDLEALIAAGEAVEKQKVLSSWGEEDIAAILEGSFDPLQPTVGQRGGGEVRLFYPGKVHMLAGESETGKTWLVLLAAKQEIEDRKHVFFFDFEDAAEGVVGRLLQMDVDPSHLKQFFHYVRPDEMLTEGTRDALVDLLCLVAPTLIVVDGVTEVMGYQGLGQNSNDDIVLFYNFILKKMATSGAAVVALDHLAKSEEKKRGSIGGVHKLNGLDGAMYRLEARKEIRPGEAEGRSEVIINKDRPGQVKKHMDCKKRIADLLVDADGDDVWVGLEAPSGAVGDVEEDKAPRTYGEKQTLSVLGDEWLTVSEVVKALNGQYGEEKSPSLSSIKRHLNDHAQAGMIERKEQMNDKRVRFFAYRKVQNVG